MWSGAFDIVSDGYVDFDGNETLVAKLRKVRCSVTKGSADRWAQHEGC